MKKLFLILILSYIYPFKIKAANDFPEPYNTVCILPEDMHGWFADVNKKYLERFIKNYNPQIIVELGVWLGKSCIFMAETSSPTTKVYAVDNWKAIGYTEIPVSAEAASKIPKLYNQFLSNVIHHKLTKKIIPVRMDTLEAAKTLDITADLIYVDASHEEEDVFNDIMGWYYKLNVGGIMCGDDFTWPSVAKGVKKAHNILKFNLQTESPFWYFIKE